MNICRGHFSLKLFLSGAFVFLTVPLFLLAQSKYKGAASYSEKSRQVLRHYLQATIDVYCDRARKGGAYPEYSRLLIREFLNSGNRVSAETWLRYGVFEWKNHALTEFYAQLVSRGVIHANHPDSFARFLRNKAEAFKNESAQQQ